MSGLQSTCIPARSWLFENVGPATGLPVFNRVLTGENIPDDFVVIGKVQNMRQEWAGMGNGRRDENYEIAGFIRIYAGGDPSTIVVDDLYAEAWECLNAITAVISTGLTVNGVTGDRRLGGNVFYAELATADETDPASPNNGGVEVGVEFTIACRAQVYI